MEDYLLKQRIEYAVLCLWRIVVSFMLGCSNLYGRSRLDAGHV